MLAQKDNIFEETYETMFRLNQDDSIRYLCEAREEGLRELESLKDEVTLRDAIIAEKNHALAEKDNALAEKNHALAEKDNENARLRAELQRLKETFSKN